MYDTMKLLELVLVLLKRQELTRFLVTSRHQVFKPLDEVRCKTPGEQKLAKTTKEIPKLYHGVSESTDVVI